jgi:hypothetical protein
MSKRSRRRVSGRRKVRRAARRPPAPELHSVAQQEVDFREEYRYVLADLKRIGALAAVMVGVLVGLSLLLP